ncbi:3-oxoacyl-ACP reductase FabG [Pseudonocardia sp. RS11V-5]|uniref:3-oxoacyl-ACP reductase FabG n=1 Tax=Pseudonocardia terrae TaxID=2905831 RepID=UPI001E37AF62|nr:3-oxoacyl-ACP reductase FabG [Pseudonocardia terrae]MCE3555920.1 3-oxoacyl-ACP reductase FabG [Pseudonocardia terrae]
MLQEQTAVITGGAKGIGFAIAETFVANGARVVLADIDGDLAQESAEKLGAVARGVACNVTDPDAVQRAVDTAVGEFGSLDVFVNNAGVTRDATLRKMTIDDFDTVIDIHLKGTWLGTRAAAAVMREQQRGAIVNLSSISGKVGMAGQTNYSAAKAGIVGMTKAAAKELAYKGVRVNAIQPGLIRTDMTAALRQDVFDAKVAEIPMQRVGDPSEIASVALFLASDLSSYMTGCVLEVTGGRHI